MKKIIFLLLLITVIVKSQEADSSLTNYNLIDSNPQNAEVFINNEYYGKTPLYFNWKDSVLPKEISIKIGGNIVSSETINDLNVIKRNYSLLRNTKSIIKNEVDENKVIFFNKKKKLVPIILSALLTAGSGFAAYYFKSLAYDNGKEYDISQDPAALDRKDKYDLFGGISIAVLQVGFGALIYYLFID